MHVGDAIARCTRLHAECLDDQIAEANVTSCLAALCAMAGRFAEAREYGRVADRVYGEVDTLFAGLGQGLVAVGRELAGDRAGAERALLAKLRFFTRTLDGEPDGRAITATHDLARLCCDDGRWDEAERWLSVYGAVHDKRETGQLEYWYGTRIVVQARIAAHRGDSAEAIGLAQHAVARFERSDDLNARAAAWLTLAGSQRRAGGGEDERAVATALAYYEQKGNVAAVVRVRETVGL